MRNVRLDEAQTGIKIARRNINNLRYADGITLMAKDEEEVKSLLMKGKEGSEKAGLKFNIEKTKVMASSSITSWQIDGEKWKQWQILFSWAPESLRTVTAAMKLKDACSFGGQIYDKPRQHIKKAETLLCWQRSVHQGVYVWM